MATKTALIAAQPPAPMSDAPTDAPTNAMGPALLFQHLAACLPQQETVLAPELLAHLQKELGAWVRPDASLHTLHIAQHQSDVLALLQAAQPAILGIGAATLEHLADCSRLLCWPTPEPVGDVVCLCVLASNVLYGAKIAEAITQSLYDQDLLNEQTRQSYRLVLQEAIANAVEHGSLGLSSTHDKMANAHEDWFESYYAKVQEMLQHDPRGQKPVQILICHDNQTLHTWVHDQGAGFDTSKVFEKIDVENPFGKGLSLAAAFSDAIAHSDGGRCFYFRLYGKPREIGFTPPNLQKAHELGKILIVDDQKINRDLAQHFLKSAGFKRLEFAENGHAALAKVPEFQPDLILLDIMMPELDGFQTCEKLKNNPATAGIPVVFLSGLTDAKSRTQGYKLRAVDYVNKPIDKNELIARAEVHILNGMVLKAAQAFATRLSEELEDARRYQLNLLPSRNTQQGICLKHGLGIYSHFAPCDELAGDYWALFDLGPDLISFANVDFTGHGVRAALNTIRFHAMFYELELLLPDPLSITFALNQRLNKILQIGQFATFLYGTLNTKTGHVSYISCGAPPLLHVSAKKSGGVTLFPQQGIPLGLVEDDNLQLQLHSIHLKPGDTLISYSDALSETSHKTGAMWDDSGIVAELTTILQETLRDTPHPDARTLIPLLLRRFNRTANKPLRDDLTLFGITFSPRATQHEDAPDSDFGVF